MIAVAWRQSASVSFSPAGVGVSGSASRMRLTVTFACGCVSAARAITARSSASTSAGFSSGTMRRSSRNTIRSGTTLVLIPPEISPTVICGEPMPGTFEVRAASPPRQP